MWVMGSWPHDTVVDAEVPTVEVTPLPTTVVAHVVENTPFPATVIDRLVLTRAPGRRHRHGGLAGQLKVFCAAAVVLALACAYAFGVLGRDDAVGSAHPSAITDPKPNAPPQTFEPALETIPLGEPWFSAPSGPEIERIPRPRAKP